MSIFLTKQKIKKEWTDYNGHMNVAYYVLIFDQYGSEELMTLFKMGEVSAKTTKKSTMVGHASPCARTRPRSSSATWVVRWIPPARTLIPRRSAR